MKKEESEFFEIMKKFRKLNISSILPGVSHGDFAVLKAVDCCMREKGLSCVRVSEVVNKMDIAPPALSRCFKMLEAKRYIVRTVDEKDRRNTCVELTEEGKRVFLETERELNSFADAVMGGMGQEDLQRLTMYLDRLLQTAQREIERRTKNREEQ